MGVDSKFKCCDEGRSFAILDETTRIQKARKIEKLVRKYSNIQINTMLEVGTGSGFIIKYFSDKGYGKGGAFAVDVVDERQVINGYNFQLIEGTNLPFPDSKFDFVISNHVIEHVGNNNMQVNHLKEIFRTLKPNGVFYFAVPNRWRFIEPHYKLPILSWFPNYISSIYVHKTRKGLNYDCKPLSRLKATTLLKEEGFLFTEVTIDAINLVAEIEYNNIFKKLITRLPNGFWKVFSPFMPTLIYICHKPMDE